MFLHYCLTQENYPSTLKKTHGEDFLIAPAGKTSAITSLGGQLIALGQDFAVAKPTAVDTRTDYGIHDNGTRGENGYAYVGDSNGFLSEHEARSSGDVGSSSGGDKRDNDYLAADVLSHDLRRWVPLPNMHKKTTLLLSKRGEWDRLCEWRQVRAKLIRILHVDVYWSHLIANHSLYCCSVCHTPTPFGNCGHTCLVFPQIDMLVYEKCAWTLANLVSPSLHAFPWNHFPPSLILDLKLALKYSPFSLPPPPLLY